jgi:hypothetical protein
MMSSAQMMFLEKCGSRLIKSGAEGDKIYLDNSQVQFLTTKQMNYYSDPVCKMNLVTIATTSYHGNWHIFSYQTTSGYHGNQY